MKKNREYLCERNGVETYRFAYMEINIRLHKTPSLNPSVQYGNPCVDKKIYADSSKKSIYKWNKQKKAPQNKVKMGVSAYKFPSKHPKPRSECVMLY